MTEIGKIIEQWTKENGIIVSKASMKLLETRIIAEVKTKSNV